MDTGICGTWIRQTVSGATFDNANLLLLSIDWIDSRLPYALENMQVSSRLNFAKNALPNSELEVYVKVWLATRCT